MTSEARTAWMKAKATVEEKRRETRIVKVERRERGGLAVTTTARTSLKERECRRVTIYKYAVRFSKPDHWPAEPSLVN